MFPSPYGVIFILILLDKWYSFTCKNIVSVSLWSYIHSYIVGNLALVIVSICVSVSLWSYIHSYDSVRKTIRRLPVLVSVSLWSYIHSYQKLILM